MMVKTSPTYNAYPLSRHVQIETQLRIVDESAAGNATVTATGDSTLGISSVSTIAKDELFGFGKAFATFETDYLRGNRTYDLMPDDWHGGFWSSVSGTPTMSFRFSAPVSCLGLSIFFDPDGQEWPSCVVVNIDNGAASYTITPDSGVTKLRFDELHTFSTLSLSFTRKSYRRIRMSGIMFGIVEEYNNSRILRWTYSTEADHLVQSLPATEQIVEVLSDNGTYRLTDPAMLPAIHPGLRMKTKVIMDGEVVQMADTILESITELNNGMVAQIKSYDIALALDNIGYTCSKYDDVEWESAESFVSEMMKRTTELYGADKVSGLPFIMPDDRKAIPFFKHREVNTIRGWLSTVAQAIQCHTYIGRDGVIRFVDTSGADAAYPSTVTTIDKSNAQSIESSVDVRVNRVEIETAITDKDFPEYVTSFLAYIINRYSGETEQIQNIENKLLTDDIGREVAVWMLKQYNRRISRTAEWRGDPAIDLFDIVSIDGNPVIVTAISLDFDGYLRGTIKGVCGLHGILDDSNIGKGSEN